MVHPIIEEVEGRVGKNIYGKQNKYPSLTLYYVFKNLYFEHDIKLNYQCIQDEKGILNVNIENRLDENSSQKLQSEFQKYFLEDIELKIQDETPIHSRNGKAQRFHFKHRLMHILFFYQYFGTPKGSWSSRAYELSRRWVAEGHQVTVITAPYEKSDIKASGFISRQEIEGIKLIVINSGDSNRLPVIQRVLRALVFAMTSIYFVFRLKYDLILASSGPITIGLPLIIGKIYRRKATIFEVRDLWPAGGIEMGMIKKKWQQQLALRFEASCYKNADIVVTASTGQKAHIQKRFPKKRIEVIPNASDLGLFGIPATGNLPSWTKGKKLFTHIGSLGLIHNMRYWMEVAKATKALETEPTIEFIFIGDGAERSKLEALKVEWELDQVHFLGLKPKADLPIWVQNSVATLFATLDNPVQDTCCPNKIFDSFAASIPIIQTSRGWIYDLVEEYKCGINVSLETPEIAAQAIINLSNEPDRKAVLGKNAFQLAKTTFNRDLLAMQYLDFISSAIKGKTNV